MVNMKVFILVVILIPALSSSCYGFCGSRKLNADLARAAVQGNEFIRSKLANKNAWTLDYIRAAAFYSLRLGGFTIDMLSELGLKDLGEAGLGNITTGRIAYYVQGVQATCQDPKSFRGHNLIKRLKNGLKEYPVVGFNHPFPYSLAVLALCNSGHGNDSYHTYTLMIRGLIHKSISSKPVHSGDTVAMATMALTCMYSKQPRPRPCHWWCYSRRRSLRDLLKRTIRYYAWWLKRQQKQDGSFGNSITSALVVQALLSAAQARVSGFPRYHCARAMRYILGRQAEDGSFSSPYVSTTMQVTPALIGAIFSDINSIKCPKPKPPTPTTHTNISVCVQVQFLTSPTNRTVPTTPPPVWVIVHNGTNAYNITRKASKWNPCYKFTTVMTAFGNSITSICGVYREPANKKYWLIYSSPNTTATTGIDNFRPKHGSCVIYKFQKLNFR